MEEEEPLSASVRVSEHVRACVRPLSDKVNVIVALTVSESASEKLCVLSVMSPSVSLHCSVFDPYDTVRDGVSLSES